MVTVSLPSSAALRVREAKARMALEAGLTVRKLLLRWGFTADRADRKDINIRLLQ